LKPAAQRALSRFREVDVDVDGKVGHASPVEAIRDALLGGRYDEIILSTLPPDVSRWLKLDLPPRVDREFDLPVVHMVAEMETP
jgi:GABA permease